MTASAASGALLSWSILAAAVGAGLTAGVFLAFSTFVMTGLGRAPAAAGVRAMQEINRAAPSPCSCSRCSARPCSRSGWQ
jgi:uncharacterized membrane protein